MNIKYYIITLYIIYITLKQLLNNVGVRIALRIQRPPESIKANQYEDLNLEEEIRIVQLKVQNYFPKILRLKSRFDF